MRPARLAASTLLLFAMVGAATSGAQGASPQEPRTPRVTASTTPTTPLRHVVVMSQEGHSFDNYLGRRDGVDGPPSGACLPPSRNDSIACVRPHPISGSPHTKLQDTAAAQAVAVDRGRMDGFVRAQAVHGADGRVAMGYYPARQLPVLTGLADRGMVFDRWFAALPGSAVANDLFAVAAAAPTDVTQVPSRGWGDTPLIFDRLQAAGISWRIYIEGYQPSRTIRTDPSSQQRSTGQIARVPVLATARFLARASLDPHVADLRRYYDDLARNQLPAVSFIVSIEHTERAPRNPTLDQQLVRGVVNGLLASASWRDSAFFLTYNTPGGWYDHVPPAKIDGIPTGLRVPTILFSPYVPAGTTNHTTYDSASILRLIEQNWSLPPLTARDTAAASLLPRFSFHTTYRAPALIDVTPSRPPVHQPNLAVLNLGYLLALLAGLTCVALVAYTRRSRRPEVTLR